MSKRGCGRFALALLSATLTIQSGGLTGGARSDIATISIVATTDLHGFVFPSEVQGGLAQFGGYVKALRTVRRSDQGTVLLLDAGDAFQGGIESDLSEGALVVDAYNALGYTAAAIGNHEFDFGAADLDGAREGHGDSRGALKARARQAHFPFLAANLIDDATGRPVDWPNVRPSVVVEAAGIRVGIIGVMTISALRATLPANAGGLSAAPLAATIAAEASKLRHAGVELVVVVAHAGGRCTAFGDPTDLSSCDPEAEIFQVARSLPRGLVNVIAAGHTHEAVAHQIEGIAIVQAYSRGQAFARVDVMMNRSSREVAGVKIFSPHPICRQEAVSGGCRREDAGSSIGPASYEGQPIAPDPQIVGAMKPALARVRDLQAVPLGVVLDTPLLRAADPESPLGNMFADALRHAGTGADAAVTNNTFGGLRADLPAGALTFGQLYDVFPFDNRIVRLTLTGAELSRMLAEQIGRRGPGALAISGIQARVSCSALGAAIDLYRTTGRRVDDSETLTVATVDSLKAGMFAAVAQGGIPVHAHQDALLREAVEGWLRRHAGPVRSDEFVDPQHPRWEYPDGKAACGGQ